MEPENSTVGSDLRAALRDQGLTMAWFAMGSVPLLEAGARQGYDAAVIDLQHGLWDRMHTHLAVGALGNVPAIIRTAANSNAAIGEALDSGAQGILVPLIENAEQALAAVAAARFPLNGKRSGGGVRPLSEGFGRYYTRNLLPLVGVMIETMAGVKNAAAIAAVPGVDFVFIGTGDLALSIGCFPEIDARHEEACQSVFDACRAIGTPCGIFTSNAPAARSRLEQGYVAVVGANDVDVVIEGFSAASVITQSLKITA